MFNHTSVIGSGLFDPLTRRAHQGDLEDFCHFVGLATADESRSARQAQVLAWRADLERRGLAGPTIRRKLLTLASLDDHLLNSNAVTGGNPVHGVKRPSIISSYKRLAD